jgi:hypothetical protein
MVNFVALGLSWVMIVAGIIGSSDLLFHFIEHTDGTGPEREHELAEKPILNGSTISTQKSIEI